MVRRSARIRAPAIGRHAVSPRGLLGAALCFVVANAVCAADGRWENPVYDSAEQAVTAAKQQVDRVDAADSAALRLFVDFTLGEGDFDGG